MKVRETINVRMYPSYLVLKLQKRRFDSSGVRHRNAMTEKACKDAVQGLGKVGCTKHDA